MDVLLVFIFLLWVLVSSGVMLLFVLVYFVEGWVDFIINIISFVMGEIMVGGIMLVGWLVLVLEQLNCLVLQVIISGMMQDQWQYFMCGMNLLDVVMNVVLFEFDGCIIGVLLFFKYVSEVGVVQYQVLLDCVCCIVGLVQWLVCLCCMFNVEKCIVFIFINFSSKVVQIGNVVGLDVFELFMVVLCVLVVDGYVIGDLFGIGMVLIYELVDCCFYDDILFIEDQLCCVVVCILVVCYV